METRNDADVDNFPLAVCLHHEGHALGNSRCRVINTKIIDVIADLVVGHRQFVSKALILIGIDVHIVAGGIPQHSKNTTAAGWVAITVDIASHFAAEARVALVEERNTVRGIGWRSISYTIESERAATDLVRHIEPCWIIIIEGVRRCDPIYDLALASAGRQQAGVIKRDTQVNNTD